MIKNILIKHFSLFSPKHLQYDELAVAMKKLQVLRVLISLRKTVIVLTVYVKIYCSKHFFLVFAERADYEFSVFFQSGTRRFIKEV